MLQSLSIQNYALIDQLDFQPCQGLSVITGETGAGKSIMLGALGLLLGERADAKAVRAGATKCVIEGTFDVADYHLEDFFAAHDLDYDAHATIVRREVYAAGKSRAYINDQPVQLPQLKALGQHLIDIHSQHQNLLLADGAFQREAVDALAGNAAERQRYDEAYGALTTLRATIARLRADAARGAQEADYLRFQFTQLDEADLRAGEQEELEAEQELLSHAEDIRDTLSAIHQGLDDDSRSLIEQLRTLSQMARSLSRNYGDAGEMAERLDAAYIDLKDLAADVEGRAADIEADPARLQVVEERLSRLFSLQKKHACDSVEALIALRDSLYDQLLSLDTSDERLAELTQQEQTLAHEAQAAAEALTATRRRAAEALQHDLVEAVRPLGMPRVRFEVRVEPAADLTPHGADSISFWFSANPGQPLQPAAQVASGGEVSRLMLALKALIAEAHALPTIIFDEVDTGVSGDIADRMGQMMQQLGQHLQVITITHLPQVAAKGRRHFKVYKEDDADVTCTHITPLTDEQRLHETARMLSGADITPEALANARRLLQFRSE